MSAAVAGWLDAQARDILRQRGHAWLLHGASGLGQAELALMLARAWLCESPEASGQACGQCTSCHAIEVHSHHDLLALMPETVMLDSGWPLPEKAQADIDDKKRKPSQEIRVDAMRDAIEFAQLTSARGRGKVVLIQPADRMNAVTANALLKTLEEPPGDVRFVLATDAAHQLLPTIRSRCVAHAMVWPQPDEVLQWLVAQGHPAKSAASAMRLSGGRPLDALALLSAAGAGADMAAWTRLPKAAAAGDVGAFIDLPAPQLVSVLQKICHDLMLRAAGAAPRYFELADLPPPPRLAVLNAWWQELNRSARHADHPFKPELLTEALVSRAAHALAVHSPA